MSFFTREADLELLGRGAIWLFFLSATMSLTILGEGELIHWSVLPPIVAY